MRSPQSQLRRNCSRFKLRQLCECRVRGPARREYPGEAIFNHRRSNGLPGGVGQPDEEASVAVSILRVVDEDEGPGANGRSAAKVGAGGPAKLDQDLPVQPGALDVEAAEAYASLC